jgi:thymidylate kinase
MLFDDGSNALPASSRGLMPTRQGRQDFLFELFRSLDKYDVRYCVLHSWERLPEDLPSDLDLAVHPSDRPKLGAVFRALRDQEFLPVQCLNYAVNAYYFVFFWFLGSQLQSVAVDVIFEHRRGGLILTSGEDLVAGRIRRDLFWIPSPSIELHYLLAKKTCKGIVPLHQQDRLKRLIEGMGRLEGENVAADLFGEQWKERVVDACLDGTLSGISEQLGRALRRTSVHRHPITPVIYFFGDSIRLIRRWLHPTGILVVILGPDGIGKSTLIGKLIGKLEPAFRQSRVFHFRPQLIKPRAETGLAASDPHGDPARGTLGSVARLIGFFVDFWVGYLLITRPLLARSGLVIFDRYFHDIIIDRKRYRYGGPRWVPRVLARAIPPTESLFLVLDAELDVILTRKREVAAGELNRLRSSYVGMASEGSRVDLIKTDEGIEKSLTAASRTIAFRMARRFEQRHGFWLGRDKSAMRDGKSAQVASL